jgi:hypothetical protein
LVHENAPGNLAAHFVQVCGKPDDAFARAEHITKIRVQVDRSTAAPMECRAIAARWDAVSGELTVWDGTQAPISVRGGLASIFALDEDKVRVIAPDVGGGFGQKVLFFYPDELLVPMAAMQLNRPVKYIEDRRENFLGSSQERTQIHEIELAALKSGEVIGLRDSFLHDTGAYIPYGIAVALTTGGAMIDQYTPAALRRPAILELAKRIEVVIDAAVEEGTQPFVDAHLHDGRVLSKRVPVASGDRSNPLSPEALRTKFRTAAGETLDAAQLNELEQALSEIETMTNACELAALLVPRAQR